MKDEIDFKIKRKNTHYYDEKIVERLLVEALEDDAVKVKITSRCRCGHVQELELESVSPITFVGGNINEAFSTPDEQQQTNPL